MMRCDLTENLNDFGAYMLDDGVDRIRFDEFVELTYQKFASGTDAGEIKTSIIWYVKCDRSDCNKLPKRSFGSFGEAYGFARMINGIFKAIDGEFNLIQKLMRGNDD